MTADDLTAFEHATAESARLAADVAESLDAELAHHITATAQSDYGSDISAYLDPRFVSAPDLGALITMGLVAGQNVPVSWSRASLSPLTRFGLLVRIALMQGREAVLDGAREEIAAHRRRAIHRAADDHPVDCSAAFCNGQPCSWPTCPDAIVDEAAEPIPTPATSGPVSGEPVLSMSARCDPEHASSTSLPGPDTVHTDRCIAKGW